MAIVFLVFIVAMAALFVWGARRRPRRHRSTYEFDEQGRMRRLPADEDRDR
jgi:hypothetical protein